MKFKNALRLSLTCWPVVLKSLFMQFAVLCLVIALSVFAFGDLASEVVASMESLGIGDTVSQVVQGAVSGTLDTNTITSLVQTLLSKLEQVIDAIPNLFNRIEFAYVIFVLILCLLYVLVTFPSMPVAYSLAEFMQTNGKRPMTWYVFKKFGKNMAYVSYRMIFEGMFNMLILFSFVGFYISSSILLSYYAFYFALFIALVLFSAKTSFLSFWLPALTTSDMSVRHAMSHGIATLITRFWHVFYKVIIINSVVMELVLLINFFFPSQVSLVISIVILMLGTYVVDCVSMVEYFEATDKKYFCKKLKSFDEVTV